MTRAGRIALVTAAFSLLAAVTIPTSAGADGPSFLTIQFGRSIEGSYYKTCGVPVAGIFTLAQVAADLNARGMVGVGTVVVNRTGTSTELCLGGDTYADWPDLQALSAQGWRFVSDGMTHNNMLTMTSAQQQAESCGSLPYFAAHGLTGANGEFAYGDNKESATIENTIVTYCFDFGRKYWTGGINTYSVMSLPRWLKTQSITGGACNTIGQSCYTPTGGQAGRHYMSSTTLAGMVAAEHGYQWIDLQFYRLVTGVSKLSASYSWDCSSSDWTKHWTSQTEMYCEDDFDTILNSVPSTTVVSDPASVYTAWSQS